MVVLDLKVVKTSSRNGKNCKIVQVVILQWQLGGLDMEEQIQFYGFRGNISFPNQISILNAGLEDNANTKNKLFVEFFSKKR